MIKLTNILKEIRVVGNVSPQMLLTLTIKLLVDIDSMDSDIGIVNGDKIINIFSHFNFYEEGEDLIGGGNSIYDKNNLMTFFNKIDQQTRNKIYKDLLNLNNR